MFGGSVSSWGLCMAETTRLQSQNARLLSLQDLVYSPCPGRATATTSHPHLCPVRTLSLLVAEGHMDTNFYSTVFHQN